MEWWAIGMIVLRVLGGVVALYVAMALGVFFSVRLKKDGVGGFELDPDSWHFRVAYPFGRFQIEKAMRLRLRSDDRFGDLTEAKRIFSSFERGICGYTLRIFLMLILGWPLIVAGQTIKILVYSPFMVIFGYYPVPTLYSIFKTRGYEFNPAVVEARKIPLPQIKECRILPVYILVLLGYALPWYFFPAGMWTVHFWVLVIVVGVVCAVLVAWAIARFLTTPNESVSLVREWMGTRWRGICPLLKVKIPDEPEVG